MSLSIDFGDAVIRSVPVAGAAVTEAASRYFGLSLHEWFYVSVIIYTLIQGWAVIYKTLKIEGGTTNE